MNKWTTKTPWPVPKKEKEETFEELVAQTIRLTQPRVGRNKPCPCGSGKKYKHCCKG